MNQGVTTIIMRVRGGEPAPPAVLAPRCGPLGMSPKKLGDDIAKATGDWKGLGVTIKMDVQNRQATISVIPSASALVIKSLKEPPRDRKKEKGILHNGNLKIEPDIIEIAKQMRGRSHARLFQGTVMEILGTCVSVGCTVDGQDPREIQKKIRSGEIQIQEPGDE
mmetsp:Transcript_6452/g.10192  ORF Transcript_6452/g.10192 Transcript_6452/m.10192 type:complete len:165 (-) Transcript_6452:214-708(-)|eukprot:CAMPEP_0202702464 /NCGR_PEP_ID=MMETSP1385-20130828/15439_1 /ASSEMBLY_ACC=CAM_ASM_000861 /TAXON_ID=933848 /ORGANISM="Elphidium margaritaceum" /LENGTH=164 /DNA_ID=CAMNT_0049360123 /DNA_START=90 /DNA_END=584 /DNA_ORIENTATION=-